MPKITLIAALSLLLSVILTVLVCRIGPRLNLIDKPNLRSSHSIPTPRGGGIGILLAFILAGILFTKEYIFVMICAGSGIIGLVSDLFNMASKARLILHLFIAALLIAFFDSSIYLPGSITIIPLALFLIIFLTASANIYNFMDGINGISGIMAAVSFGLLAFFSYREFGIGSPMTILAIAIIFSSIGFLRFNMPNARIFMGDVGSIFLGFTFAGITILLSKNIQDFICLASFLFIFYADEAVTAFLRLKDGENLLFPHRRHLYQILANEARVAHWKISCGYGAAQLLIGLTVLSLRPMGPWTILPVLSLYFTAFIALNVLIRRRWRALKRA